MAKTNNPKNTTNTVQMEYLGKNIDIDLYSKFDVQGFDKDTIVSWYRIMHLGRKLDEKAALYLKMAKGWSYHAPFAGHDGIQLALGLAFRANKDFLFPYYRDMLTSLAAGITPVEIILNGLSRDTDVAGKGRHMSNHFAKPSIGIQNVSSCTGNHSLHAAGTARAIQRFNSGGIAYYSSGESACSEGYFWEAINVATLEKLPVIFVVQNNKYGISVPLRDQTANQITSENYRGMKDLLIINCDGRDPFDCMRALNEAAEYVTTGKGPAFIHADCDRIGSHSNSDRHELYRSKEELETVRRRDPLMQFRYHIIDKGILTEEELNAIEESNKEAIFAAADEAEAAPAADASKYEEHLIPEPYYKGEDFTEPVLDAEETISYIEAVNHTLKEEFRANPKIFMWGQDLGKGGVFNVVKGMPEEFGKERVFNAPIAEDCIVGTANGFSRFDDEIRVVVEGAEFADYFWPAMEQLIECSHDYWRTAGQFSPNVTIRLASGGYIQGGLYHSQNLEAIFATQPGIRIVNPVFASDAVGLLRNTIRSRGTTIFIEPKFLYNFKGAHTPVPPKDYIIPFGRGRIIRSGSDLSIITYGNAVHISNTAAEELERQHGIKAEIIDLRSIKPWDKEMVFESVKKTGRVLVAHEDRVFGGFGGEISSAVTEELFRYLDAPVMRVGSKDTPVGFAKSYENAILLNSKDIINNVIKLVNY